MATRDYWLGLLARHTGQGFLDAGAKVSNFRERGQGCEGCRLIAHTRARLLSRSL